MKPEPIIHLLIPKEFKVWCLHNRPPGPKMNITMFPSKATCANCLSNFRYANGKKPRFKVRWTSRHDPNPRTPELEA